MVSTAFLLVSQSVELGKQVAALARPLAPDVEIACCGAAAATLPEAVAKISTAVSELRGKLANKVQILILTDVGSSAMAVSECLTENEDRRTARVRAPFLEGTLAGVVAAQQGADSAAVTRSAMAAAQFFADQPAPALPVIEDDPDTSQADLVISLPEGVSARPAALIARIVSDSGCQVELNGVDASSVLGLMRAKLENGDTAHLHAHGETAAEVISQITAILTPDVL